MRFADLIPGLETWTRSLKTVWPAPLIESTGWLFPLIEVFHLLALTTVSGCVILLGLRLSGFGLTSISLSAMEKSVRPLLWGALVVVIISGLLMSLVIAPRLYARPAFLIKMIAFAAALLLSYGVAAPVARREGAFAQKDLFFLAPGAALWLFAIWHFATTSGPAPGTLHVVVAGWLLVMGFGSQFTRLVLGAITAVIVVAFAVTTYGVYHPLDNYEIVMEIDRWTLRVVALLVAVFMFWEFARPNSDASIATPRARLLGLFTILAWVTVAAAGRWIGLGGAGQ